MTSLSNGVSHEPSFHLPTRGVVARVLELELTSEDEFGTDIIKLCASTWHTNKLLYFRLYAGTSGRIAHMAHNRGKHH